MSAENISYDLKRFAGIKRDYTPEEVERLRGSIKIEYSMCKHQSTKLWNLLNSEPYVNTLGSLSGNHAVQHAKAYSWLQMRSTMVPMVSIASRFSTMVIFVGLMLGFGAGLGLGYWVVLLGFIMMGVATLFSFVTLPVEYDASNRALAWLKNRHIVSREEYKDAEDALRWAARTYLVAALGALATLVYWALQIFGRR